MTRQYLLSSGGIGAWIGGAAGSGRRMPAEGLRIGQRGLGYPDVMYFKLFLALVGGARNR